MQIPTLSSVMHVQTCWNLPAQHVYKCSNLPTASTLHLILHWPHAHLLVGGLLKICLYHACHFQNHWNPQCSKELSDSVPPRDCLLVLVFTKIEPSLSLKPASKMGQNLKQLYNLPKNFRPRILVLFLVTTSISPSLQAHAELHALSPLRGSLTP